MDLGLYIAATGMVAEQTRQDQLSNDLANATTPGYKSDAAPQHNFGAVLLANTEGGTPIGSVDAGVTLGKTYTDMTQGSIQETGEPLDFALTGPGFFAVKTAQGVRYTRNGQFITSAQGELTDSKGNPVLGQGGAPIKVPASGTLAASAFVVTNTAAYTFVDANGDVLNGTVFLGSPGDPNSARAVTIFGPTALLRPWRWNGKQWTE